MLRPVIGESENNTVTVSGKLKQRRSVEVLHLNLWLSYGVFCFAASWYMVKWTSPCNFFVRHCKAQYRLALLNRRWWSIVRNTDAVTKGSHSDKKKKKSKKSHKWNVKVFFICRRLWGDSLLITDCAQGTKLQFIETAGARWSFPPKTKKPHRSGRNWFDE